MAGIEKKNAQSLDIQFTAEEYKELLLQAVAVIESARCRLARQAAATTNETYWEIGKLLYDRKLDSTHGSRVVRQLSVDLKERYPNMGMSPRNLWYMRSFYERYDGCDAKVQRAVALLPWSHNLLILSKNLDNNATLYYAQEVVSKGWSRDLLLNALKLKLHESHPLVPMENNFSAALPAEQAKYANEVFRGTYNLGFLGVTSPILELELEARLVEKIKLFLLELGEGFTFIGNQHVLTYNGKESKVDMLFFHRKLRCLVAIDLKIGEFLPEYAGKMNFYLSLLDRLEKGEDENRSIGIILCAEKNNEEVALTLEEMGKPIGVADYQLLIPKQELQKAIVAEIETFKEEHKQDNE